MKNIHPIIAQALEPFAPPTPDEQKLSDAMHKVCGVADQASLDREIDAQLISAAPELLEACKAALFDESTSSSICEWLRTAIAKAEGSL